MSKKAREPKLFTIGIDSREQKCYKFSNYSASATIMNLGHFMGDYTLANRPEAVRIERKASADELCSWFGKKHEQMNKTLVNLASFPVRCIVLEFELKHLLNPVFAKRMHRNSVLGNMAKIARLGIPMYFLGGRRNAESFVFRLLSQTLQEIHKGGIIYSVREYEHQQG